MMPGMTGFVVRRRREMSGGQALAPVRLAFEMDTVAGGTVLHPEACLTTPMPAGDWSPNARTEHTPQQRSVDAAMTRTYAAC